MHARAQWSRRRWWDQPPSPHRLLDLFCRLTPLCLSASPFLFSVCVHVRCSCVTRLPHSRTHTHRSPALRSRSHSSVTFSLALCLAVDLLCSLRRRRRRAHGSSAAHTHQWRDDADSKQTKLDATTAAAATAADGWSHAQTKFHARRKCGGRGEHSGNGGSGTGAWHYHSDVRSAAGTSNQRITASTVDHEERQHR